jgi:glycosyltransferase involved in cell wall biosynthesis
MAMRVLIGSAYFESHRGGIEIVAGRLARELQRRGAEVTWFATDSSLPPEPGSGIAATRPIKAWNVTERVLGVPLPLPGPAGIAALCRHVRSTDVVLLHDSLYPTNVAAMLAARWHRKPVVLTQHIASIQYRNRLLRGMMAAANALIARPMLAAADQVAFISAAVAAQFAHVRFTAEPRLIFNGVDTDIFKVPPAGFDANATRASLGLSGSRPLVLFVGRFVEKKGLHLIERLARRRPDLNFVLAGWGPIDPAAWRLANVDVRSDLQAETLVPLYQSSDVLLLPSVGEGLPLVLQEALACGLPVICASETAAADPGARAHIDGVDIDGVDPDTAVAALDARIDAVVAENSGARRAANAQARHAYVRARYSWSEAARAYLSIISAPLEKAPAHAVGPVSRTPSERT